MRIRPAFIALAFAAVLTCGGDHVMEPEPPDKCPAEDEVWDESAEACCTVEDGVTSCPGDLR